jgi:hypothetical protein
LQGLPPGDLHLFRQYVHPAGVTGGHLHGTGVQHHEADPVTDDVVHFSGDPHAFGEHGLLGAEFLVCFGSFGSFPQGVHQLGAGRHIGPEGGRPQHERDADDDPGV